MATNIDIPEITITGIPVSSGQTQRVAGAGDASWTDQLFQSLMGAGSAVLQYELQKDALKTAIKLQNQYGQLYSSPGSFFAPVTGQGPATAGMVGGFNPMVLLLAAGAFVAFLAFKD